jgi:glycosyltransferase involved in cell wall biosynthesis
MRIGIDARVLMDKYYSGVSEYTFCLVRELLAQDKTNEYVLFYNSAKNIKSRVQRFDQVNVSYKAYRFPNKLFNYGWQKILSWPKLDKVMGVDIFFAPHINFISLARPQKSILTIHDLSYWRYPEYFSARKNFWHRAVGVKKLINSFSWIVAVSQNTKQDIKELSGRKRNIKIIYSGLSPEFKKLPADDSRLSVVQQQYKLPKKFILFLANLEPRKNVCGLIKAYEILRQQFSQLAEYKLVIAGAWGWRAEPIKKVSQEAKYKDDILFLGYVRPKDKTALYNLASLFVYPSFYEGFGFPPLEAAACGVPVVTSSVSSLPEVVGSSALLINPFKPQEIAQAMAQILLNPSLADKLRLAGLKQAQKFSWPEAARQYLKLFAQMGEGG